MEMAVGVLECELAHTYHHYSASYFGGGKNVHAHSRDFRPTHVKTNSQHDNRMMHYEPSSL